MEVGIRCGRLDVALIYSLILGAFLSQTSGRNGKRVALLALAVLGAAIPNSLRWDEAPYPSPFRFPRLLRVSKTPMAAMPVNTPVTANAATEGAI